MTFDEMQAICVANMQAAVARAEAICAALDHLHTTTMRMLSLAIEMTEIEQALLQVSKR